ncbi:MAG: hypothetical protein AAF635_10080 [Cyanobacteria bacterium P01_C01_bin.69]
MGTLSQRKLGAIVEQELSIPLRVLRVFAISVGILLLMLAGSAAKFEAAHQYRMFRLFGLPCLMGDEARCVPR